jgi:Leucine Rich repeat
MEPGAHDAARQTLRSAERKYRLGRLPSIRLSVRSLMLLVLVAGCWLGWYLQGVRRQQDAVDAVVKARGTLDYDWDKGHYDPDSSNYGRKPLALKWLAERLGVDYVANVIDVSLIYQPSMLAQKPNDETLRRVSQLSRLERLRLWGTDVTDAGLAHVKRLTHLHELNLSNSQIGDAGLANLEGMTNLRQLSVASTRVTDAGVLALEKSLPDLHILRDEDMQAISFAPNVGDLHFALSQPVRLSCALLLHRARVMASNHDSTQLTTTIEAICSLEANDKFSLLRLAEARAQCLGILEPTYYPDLPGSDRAALQRRCADRGIAALSLAVDKGYNNLKRLEGDSRSTRILWNLHSHPGFAEIIARIKASRAAR